MTVTDAQARARRSDAGTVWTMERDRRALRWVAEQFTVRDDVLAVLLARLGESDPRRRAADRVGASTARQVVRRWTRGGYAQRRRMLDHAWTLPTGAGYRLAGIEARTRPGLDPATPVMEPWEVRGHLLAHVHAVGVVRLAVEAALEDDQRWISERELRRVENARMKREGLQRSTVHVPDGAVEGVEGDRVAIEVELSLKGRAMFDRAVHRRLPPGFHGVRMFVAPRLAGELTARLARMDVPVQTTIEPLPDLGISYMEG
jgi:hypothetical protein